MINTYFDVRRQLYVIDLQHAEIEAGPKICFEPKMAIEFAARIIEEINEFTVLGSSHPE